MQLVQIVIAVEEDFPESASEATLTDILWAATRPEDAVEHITVRCDGKIITIGVFTRRPEPTGVHTARTLVERAREMSPLLRNLPVTDARKILLAGLMPGTLPHSTGDDKP